MRILITGCVGHVGTNITNEAIKRGHSVVGMDNLHRKEVINNLRWLQKTYTKEQFEFVWGDVREQDDFKRLPQGIEAIIHLAGQCGVLWSIQWPTYDFETNARGTLNALEFAKDHGKIPFIYASTNKTFSDVINEIPTEEKEKRYVWKDEIITDPKLGVGIDFDFTQPIAINELFSVTGFGSYGHSMYGISKLVGDLYCQEYHAQYGLPIVINKMSCIYGLFQKGVVEQGWISWFLRQIGLGNGEIEFYGTGKQVRDVLDARDVARLYIDELERIKECNGEIFTVGGGPKNTVSLIEAVEEIERQTMKKTHIVYKEKRPADQDIYISSLKRVKEVLGWEPKITFSETITDMIREYLNE